MENTQFYEVMPDGRYKFRIDHHTINDFNTCDRYFEFRHMPADAAGHVWSPKGLTPFKTQVGSWWSDVMESFYHEMSFGALPELATMIRLASEHWRELKMDDYAQIDPEKYDKFGGFPAAQLMSAEYYEAFAKTHFEQWIVVGAETGFGWRDELKLGEDDRVVVYYGGKPDLVVVDKAQNMLVPLDFKTKDHIPGNVSTMWKPHPQTAGYIFAVRSLLDQIAGTTQAKVNPPTKCILMVCARLRPSEKPRSGVRQPRFVPVYANYATVEIEEWRVSVMEKCRRLRDAIERNMFIPRESACHLFYHGCAFRRVCSVPAATREMMLNADFVKIDPWTPYTPEED